MKRTKISKTNIKKAWVIAVDMGYGHLRTAYALKDIAYREIINANNYPGIPREDRKIWRQTRKIYEKISQFKQVPLIGDLVFNLYDKFQAIPKFYPRRNLSKPNLQVTEATMLIRKKNWGKHLINQLKKKPLPLVTTYFVISSMAEIFNYPGEIYCVICDTDVSRSWVSKNPTLSKINYFAPSLRVAERLKLYGVPHERILLSGFPLPKENLGSRDKLDILKKDLAARVLNLDPNQSYSRYYKEILVKHLDWQRKKNKSHPLTLTFAVGGAGAQRELGASIVKSLKTKIINKEIKINLVAGIHNDVATFFRRSIRKNGLASALDSGYLKIIFAENKRYYFRKFNLAMKTTDILWTKPSELSFYCALGIPIIIAEPIGSQERFNREWLIEIGAGFGQKKVEYTEEWLFDWLKNGRLAEAAMDGYLEAPKLGVYNIEKKVLNQE
jgi:hypothetical protein